MKIAIGCDHAAFELKKQIVVYLEEKGYEVKDLGTNSEARCDYPVFGEAVGRAVASGECEKGIAICGTGVGIGIAANKVAGVRCVTCSEPVTARLSREHNDSNVLAFGARIVGFELAKGIVDAWLEGLFQGGRHAGRIAMFEEIARRNG